MRYFGFLARYVVFPLVLIRLLLGRDGRNERSLPDDLASWPADTALLAHAAVAVAYTTVWDNYLVYSGIWSYDRRLVSGLRIGWVPLEEYTFFVLQPLLTGSLLLWLARRIPAQPAPTNVTLARSLPTAALLLAWIGSLLGLRHGGERWRYMSLICGWALPPMIGQTAFGGDLLWRRRKLIAAALVPASIYLGLADSRAIRAGTWAINADRTIGMDVVAHLPLEEFLFFCLTNMLLIFGITLVLSEESESRLPARLRRRYAEFKARYMVVGR
jgi:lycopene beta-cyclase